MLGISQAWAVEVECLLHLPWMHFPAWVRTRRRGIGSWGTGQTCEQSGPEELTFP